MAMFAIMDPLFLSKNLRAYQQEMQKNMNVKSSAKYRKIHPPQPIRGAPSTATHLPKIGMCSLCMGTFFVVASMILLSWNESSAMVLIEAYERAINSIHKIENASRVHTEFDGDIVFISAPLSTDHPLFDPLCNLSVNAGKLKRSVFMYQWIEKQGAREIERDGEVRQEIVYTYEKVWEEHLIDSNNFDDPSFHRNPINFKIKPLDLQTPLKLGAYQLSPALTAKISNWKEVPLSRLQINPHYKIWYSSLYTGLDPFYPAVGDFKITWLAAGMTGSDNVSIVAKLEVSSDGIATLVPFVSEKGIVMVVEFGYIPPENLVERNLQPASMTWLIRLVCVILMYLGLFNLSGVFVVLGNFIKGDHSNDCFPTAGNVTRAVFFCCLLIALQWFHLRPLYSAAILVLGVVPAWLLTIVCRKCAELCEDDDEEFDEYSAA